MGLMTAGHGAPFHPQFSASLIATQRHLALVSIRETGGLLPQNNFWNYLHWRHDLNPQRFDHYHPIVGRWIERDEALRQTHAPSAQTPSLMLPPSTEATRSLPPTFVISSPWTPSGWTGQGGGLVPPPHLTPTVAAPEPSSALMGALALAIVPFLIRQGRRRRSV